MVNLPGWPKAVGELEPLLRAVLPHAVGQIRQAFCGRWRSCSERVATGSGVFKRNVLLSLLVTCQLRSTRPQGPQRQTAQARYPGLKSGTGAKKKVAAPQRRGVCTRVYTTTPERSRTPHCGRWRVFASPQRHRGHGVHSGRGPQPAGALRLCSCVAVAWKDLPGVRYKVVRGTARRRWSVGP